MVVPLLAADYLEAVWDVNTGQCLQTLQDDNEVWSVAFNRMVTLASGSDDNTMVSALVNVSNVLGMLRCLQ